LVSANDASALEKRIAAASSGRKRRKDFIVRLSG
jgi:hypothetical protein